MKGKRQPFSRGFYRYCDHWCLRCLDRPRCRLYTGGARTRRRSKGRPPDEWEAALQDVKRSFEEIRSRLQEAADARGADAAAFTKNAVTSASRRASLRHPLTSQGSRFHQQCDGMVRLLRDFFEEAGQDIASRSGFLDVRREAEALDGLRDVASVLHHDGPTVLVKTRHALEAWYRAKVEAARGEESAALEEAFVTAAVVLRCLKRDEAALRAVYESDEKFQSAAIDLLACGEAIGRGLEELFPGAAALAGGRNRRSSVKGR